MVQKQRRNLRKNQMKLLAQIQIPPQITNRFPKFKGYSVALFQRKHNITPFIVCALDNNQIREDGEANSKEEWGFWGFSSISDPQQILSEAMNKLVFTLQTN